MNHVGAALGRRRGREYAHCMQRTLMCASAPVRRDGAMDEVKGQRVAKAMIESTLSILRN